VQLYGSERSNRLSAPPRHCAQAHSKTGGNAQRVGWHRYLAEYEFRYNHRVARGIGDIDRTLAAIMGAEGKRLLHRQPHQA
jgi:hypothetical protein